MIETNWCVITGGPSSGKTTLINHLDALGYQTAPEVARELINRLLNNQYSLEEIRQNTLSLQRAILATALKRERRLQKNALIFFDRGTPDSLGYFRYYQINADKIAPVCKKNRYKKLFYCHPLPLEHDMVRVEDNVSAPIIGTFIYEAYQSLGYELIELPAVSIAQRLAIIGAHIHI